MPEPPAWQVDNRSGGFNTAATIRVPIRSPLSQPPAPGEPAAAGKRSTVPPGPAPDPTTRDSGRGAVRSAPAGRAYIPSEPQVAAPPTANTVRPHGSEGVAPSLTVPSARVGPESPTGLQVAPRDPGRASTSPALHPSPPPVRPVTVLPPSSNAASIARTADDRAVPAAGGVARPYPKSSRLLAAVTGLRGTVRFSVLTAGIIVVAGVWWFAGASVTVSTEPPGSAVLVNGIRAGASGPDGALRLGRLRRGGHRLRIEQPGFHPVDRDLLVGWFIVRERVTVSLPPAFGKLTLANTGRDAAVLVDGVQMEVEILGNDRSLVRGVPQGKRAIEVRRSGFLPWRETMVVTGATEVAPNLQPDFSGEWSGTASAGNGFRLPVHLAVDHGADALVVSNISPSGVRFPLDNPRVFRTELTFSFGTMSFTGILSPDGSTLSGRVAGGLDATWTAVRHVRPGRPVGDEPADPADEALARARSLFGRRQYRAALDACAEVLERRPEHAAAHRLRTQIEQTMDVLSIPR